MRFLGFGVYKQKLKAIAAVVQIGLYSDFFYLYIKSMYWNKHMTL